MKPMLEYKGYLGSAEVSIEDGVIHGKLLYIRDVVSYEAESPADIEAAFRAAVDDYLETCAECGDAPDAPFKGSFNVRLGPELHRGCALAADRAHATLNEWVKAACEAKLAHTTARPERAVHINVTNHHHHHAEPTTRLHQVEESPTAPLTTLSTGARQWTM